jgi:hypothetical protein
VNPRLLAAGLLVSAALTGCSSGDEPSSTPSPSAPVDVWNPCDGLTAARIGKALGAEVRMDKGSTDAPRCAFLPTEKGGPVTNVTYGLFAGGIDEIWRTMGVEKGVASHPRVPGADAARLLVKTRHKAAALTGFVQNGDLVQIINVLDPRPYDRASIVAAGVQVMRDLSAHADEAGVK